MPTDPNPGGSDRLGRLIGMGYIAVFIGFLAVGYGVLVWDKAGPAIKVLVSSLVIVTAGLVVAVVVVARRVRRSRRGGSP